MSGSSNFLQWNPTASNQENDSAYLADTTRTGGAVNDQYFVSPLGNKLFYQLSTAIAALMGMLAAKGYTVSDASLSTLQSTLACLLTTNDIRGNLQQLSYSVTQNLNESLYLGWQIALAGNTTLTTTGAVAGDRIALLFVQNATGGYTVTYPSTFYGALQPDPAANAISLQIFEVDAALNYHASTPMVSATSMFAPNPPTSTDSTQRIATTSWVQNLLTGLTGFVVSLGPNGYIQFPSWIGAPILQWGQVNTDINAGTLPVSFSKTFPSACYAVNVTTHSATDRITYVVYSSVTTSGFTIGNNGSGGYAFWWAVGK
jgi:hypothetical protein